MSRASSAPAEQRRRPLRGRARESLRGVRLVLRRVLVGAEFAVLLAWFKVVGPPRVLVFTSEMNARILRAFGARVGHRKVYLQPPITLYIYEHGYYNLTIGDECSLSGNNFLDLMEEIVLEDGVSLGPGVTLMTHDGFVSPQLRESLPEMVGRAPVRIEAGAAIRAHALILRGVTVGRAAVVAPGAVVEESVPARQIVTRWGRGRP